VLEIGLFFEVSVNRLDDTRENLAGRTIDGDIVSLVNYNIRAYHAEKLLFFIDADPLGACDTGQTQPRATTAA